MKTTCLTALLCSMLTITALATDSIAPLSSTTAATYITHRTTVSASPTPSRWFIFTGGPSTGKTSVLAELKRRGYAVITEAATEFIQSELDKGITEPWLRSEFQTNISRLHRAHEETLKTSAAPVAFVDRGPLDSLSYVLFYNKTASLDAVVELVNQGFLEGFYQPTVFFFQDLGFCEGTAVRHEERIEAQALAHRFKEDYTSIGCTIVEVPTMSIEERADFIERHLQLPTA